MRRTIALFVLLVIALTVSAPAALDGFIKLKDGYFYDSATGEAWVPHGIAYQLWNRPLGVWQTYEQIDYDLDEIVKMGANSVRIDMVWQHIEGDGATSIAEGDNNFAWEKWDYFVQACEQRNLRIFALIGYQWPPNWFPDEWYTMHPPETDAEGIYHPERWQSDIINYEHPAARAQYAEWLAAVAGHFKDSKAIVGWIVGNESGYLGLWSGLLDGYDPESEAAFRVWCQAKYGTIGAVNAAWGTSFPSFNDIVFVEQYRAYGPDGAEWADMVQWREDSIASFTAVGAVGAKSADTNHLISYSTVGMQWGEEDWRYHAEDRGKITAACIASNAPIDFFSVNNYPWSVLGHESQNGQWGISYTKKVAKVPVLYSETGFTSSETMWPGMNEFRQGPLVRNALWESLEAGAVGTHIFSWMDRPYITDREKGFGIVYSDRRAKPALWTSRDTFNLMEQVDIHGLLMGSEDPTPDIAFLWTDANDSQYNRYECEMQQIAGALERLGYEPNFIDLQDLAAGAYTDYEAIILPRNMRVEDTVPGYTNSILNFLLKYVIPAGVDVMATADLPGMQDFNGRPRAAFTQELNALFGIDASDIGGFEAPMRRNEYVSWYWHLIEVDFNANSPINGYHCWPQVWKYSDEIKVTDGTLWATMDSGRNKGYEESNTSVVKWDGTWGDVIVRSGWGWAYDGNNMVQMWGDSGMWKDEPVVPFGRYTHSAYLRSNAGDPLAGGKQAYVAIEWRDQDGNVISTSESTHLVSSTPGDSWVQYKVDAIAPADSWTARRIIRIEGSGSGSVYVDHKASSPAVVVKNHGTAKAGIFLFSAGDQKPDSDLNGDPDVNAWQWRYDYFGAMIKNYFGIQPQVEVTGANAYLCLPEYRTCADGSTLWQIKNYMYDTNYPASYESLGGGAPQTFTISSPLFVGKTIEAFDQSKIIEENSDGTIQLTLDPDGMEMLIAYNTIQAPAQVRGHWRMDEARWSGILDEVKDSSGAGNHGRAYNGPTTVWGGQVLKAGSFDGVNDYVEIPNDPSLQITGDMTLSFWLRPVNLGSARINPVDKSYGGEFGLTIETSGQLSYYHGTARASGKYWSWAAFNAGTLKNGEWQHVTITRKASTRVMKSYLNGALMKSTTYSTSTNTLPAASTYPVRIAQGYTGVRYKGLVDEVKMTAATLGDGEVAAEYAKLAASQIVRIKDSPAVMHPMGDKLYTIKVGYDCGARSDLSLKCAFMEYGDNGDGTPDEKYQELSEAVTEDGEHVFWMWTPDPDSTDSDYISTPDGGQYRFVAWLEDASGAHVADAVPVATALKWGVHPTAALPTSMEKGDQVSIPIEWEELYEYLPWETTPLVRNDVFPNRVAIFRSLKTEAQYPGQLDRVNQVCDWMENMGYSAGNPLDISFDNVKAKGVFGADFEDGLADSWGSGLTYSKYTTYSLNASASRLSYKVVADATKTISKISIHAAAFGTCPTYTLAIYADNGSGKPTGSPLVSQNFTHTGTAYTWKEIAIPAFTWTEGTTYHIVIQYASGTINTSNYLRPYYIGADTAGRKVLYSTNSGSTWTEQTYEPTFLLQYTDGSRLDQPYGSVSSVAFNGTTLYGQKFTRFSSLAATDITVMLKMASGSSGAIELNIRRWSDKSLVASATLASPALTTAFAWKTFTFGTPALLEAGVPYYYELRRIGGAGTYYAARVNTVGSKGSLSWGGLDNYTIYSSNGGASWSAQTHYDFGFLFNRAGWSRIAGAANWTLESAAREMDEGSGLIYSKYTTYGLSAAARRLSYKVVADASKTISTVSIYARTYGTCPTYTLAIYADDGAGKPTGAPLVSQNFTHTGTAYTWKQIAIPALTWTEGATYHLVMHYASGTINSTNYLLPYYIGPDTPGRKVLYSTNSGSTWTAQTYEPTFRIGYSDGTTYNQPYGSVSSVAITTTAWYGQKFTPVYNMSVEDMSVLLRAAAAGTTGAIELNIRRWSDKSLVATATLATPGLTTAFAWYSFTFGTPAALESGTTYYYELKRIGGSGTYYVARVNTVGSLGTLSWGGLEDCAIYSSNSGGTWSSQTHYDFGFVMGSVADQSALRVTRVGNDDNMFAVDDVTSADGVVSADICYNKQGPYFNDAELYCRFVDRNNFYKVGFRNFFGFWRIVYEVRYQGALHAVGIIHEFDKTTRPVEGEWYNLAVSALGTNFTVLLDGEAVGSFSSSLIPSGGVAVGASAVQLGIWEPQKGYYFIDDDEYSYYAPEGQPTPTNAASLNLDWGYLSAFFPTLILPSTYVMSDIEVSNVETWIGGGLRTLIAIDGGIAMKNETGATDMGRIEGLFGVAPAVSAISGLAGATIGSDGHYVTLDYDAGDQIAVSGNAMAWTTPTTGVGLGTIGNGTVSAPALIVNKIEDDPQSPKKVFCFNFGADTGDQLTGALAQIGQRAFEWAQGEAYKVQLELKYQVPQGDPSLDLTLLTVEGWVLNANGTSTLVVDIPDDGIMTGDNLYWVLYVHPWDAAPPWVSHGGFYTSANDGSGVYVSLAGQGLQLLGMTDKAYAGREWDMWVAYNTRGTNEVLTFGLKDQGSITVEDNFDDGDSTGWTVTPNANIAWSVVGGALRATVLGSGGYAYMDRTGLDVSDQNITIECDILFTNNASYGGLRYRGVYLDLNPTRIGWRDNSGAYLAGLSRNVRHHVVLNVRDGDPYMVSDLFVDDQAIFVNEPIEVTSFANTSVGFVSPYYYGYVEWDNVRIADEAYTLGWLPVNGQFVPTNELEAPVYVFVPDYDPDLWEHNGTVMGSEYEWFTYFRGEDLHSLLDTKVYFAPRLMMEDPNFPTEIAAGTTVSVPVEWENLEVVPAKLRVELVDPYSGATAALVDFLVTTATGSGSFPVSVPSNAIAGVDYLWSAIIYPTNALDPMAERLGLDDTYRFDHQGQPIEPEVPVQITAPATTAFVVYSDAGIASGSDIYTWSGGSSTWDAHFTILPPPEGTESFYTLDFISWVGWGIFRTAGTIDLSQYSGGYLKFWLWSFETLKVELQGPQGTANYVNVGSTGGSWQEITIPLSSFPSVNLSQMYGLFSITSYDGAEYLVDHVRFSETP